MSVILNKEELAVSPLRKDALEILEAGYLAIDTEKILRKQITLEEGGALCIANTGFQCSFYERIFFIGIGKCAYDGAKVIEDILGDKLTDGIALDVVDFAKSSIARKVRYFQGTHPYPSEQNLETTKKILEMIKGVTEKDLVLVLISGGGSSLLCLPHNINCETLISITKTLTKKGADIFELNTVRKHFSEVQGGGLAKICYPAQVVSLIFSDVLGDDISMIASGPTVLDITTIEDAKEILRKYDIEVGSEVIETSKDQRYFKNVKNALVCSNKNALEAMKIKAEELGFDTSIETTTLSGDANEVGQALALRKPKPKTCILFGGETTVKIKGDGEGGRNQELVLSALPHIKPNSILIATSSDGWDNTDHAGAIVDTELLEKAKQINLSPGEYLEKNDSYNFFKKITDGAIYTGRLGSNVSDLYILLYE